MMTQKMADLPMQRLYKTPPFWHSGIDVFGPFNIRHGRTTRANTGIKKIWVLLFTCLYSRAIHLETLDSMDTASFKMAFQRFQDIRGDFVYLRSDAGSNFMGARNEVNPTYIAAVQQTKSSWEQEEKVWDVNPPTASHFGGVWERAIGEIRRIFEGYLITKENRLLDRE